MSLTRVLSIALCAAALCAAPSRPSAQTRTGTPPPVSDGPPPPSPSNYQPPPTPAKPTAPPRKVVPGFSAPAGWQRYEVGEPRLFAFNIPAEHEVETEAVRLGPGLVAHSYTYSGETDDGTYLAYYIEKLPIDAERMSEKYKTQFYAGVWQGLVGGIRQELEQNGLLLKFESGESRPAKVSGLDAREQDFTLGFIKGRARMVLSGSRVFLVLVMEDGEAGLSVTGLAFLNSLEVYPAPR